MKTALALTLVLLSVSVLAGCPDNNAKPGSTPTAASGAPAASGTSAAPADTSKGGSGW